MNRDQSSRLTGTLLVVLALCTSACMDEPASSDTANMSHAGARLPDGLPEGINDTFMSEDPDVEKFIERFEGESREIYVGRHAIVASLGLSQGDRIADIGAGTGF